MNNKEIPQDQKKKVLTLFLLFFPSMLIAIIPSTINSSIIMSFVFKFLLLFYQYVILQNFINTYYGE